MRNIFKEEAYRKELITLAKYIGLASICLAIVFLGSWATLAIIEVLNWNFWLEFGVLFICICFFVALTILVGFTLGYIFKADEW